MRISPAGQLETPRFENGQAQLIAGLRSRYTGETMNNIPAQWQRFAPHLGKVPGQIGQTSYGVVWTASKDSPEVEYLAGVEVSGDKGLPSEFTVATIPALRYAVFHHGKHVAKIRETIDAIFHRWLPESGHQSAHDVAGAPDFIERYSEDFDPKSGMGGTEIWVPIKT
jgi:AraC family transcriptional regulator